MVVIAPVWSMLRSGPEGCRAIYTAFTSPSDRRISAIGCTCITCYQIGVLPRPTSLYLKEELRDLDRLTERVDYMAVHHIETLKDLHTDRRQAEEELTLLVRRRTKLQNKIRRAEPEEKKELREEKQNVTS